jgi:hypothetical protein
MSLFGGNSDSSSRSESEPETTTFQPFGDELENNSDTQYIEYVSPVHSDSGNSDGEDESIDSGGLTGRPQPPRSEIAQRRRWQAEEIQLTISLENQRASDLNENLYELGEERRLFQSQAQRSKIIPWQSRNRWVKSKKPELAIPPSEWTSWPLDPHEVPLSDEWFDNTKFGSPSYRPIKKQKLAKPSAEMEEILCDIAIKKCRRRWQHDFRGSSLDSQESRTPRLHSDRRNIETFQMDVSTHSADSSTIPPSDLSHVSVSDVESTSTEILRDKHSQQPGFPFRAIEKGMPYNQQVLTPAFSADDELSHQILRPSMRHILFNLDKLFTGLYHSRINQDKANTYAQIFNDTQQKGGTTPEPQFSPILEYTTGTKSDTHRGRKWTAEDGPSMPHRLDSPSLPGPRDWSELLGMATITGWDTQAVERAAERCAKLFGEDMAFKTLSEDDLGAQFEPVHIAPSFRSSSPTSDTIDSKPKGMVGGVHVDGFMQPIVGRQGWRGKDKEKSRVRGQKGRKGSKLEGTKRNQHQSVDIDHHSE